MSIKHAYIAAILSIFLLAPAPAATAQSISASDIAVRSEVFFAPQSGSFIEGSVFEVPIFINTKGSNINAIELHIKFDPTRLSIINPSGGKSIIGLWVQPPSYDNTKGTVDIVGGIPNGLTTSSGLIATMTFRAKATGQAIITVGELSRILQNDGLGLPVPYEANRGTYAIVPKPPEGVLIFSETHPFQDSWYNNRSPVFSWNQDAGVTGFSVAFDNKPTTVPGNTITTTDPVFSIEDLDDGLWYLHVKAIKKGVWGNTTHYLTRIDGTPPAAFVPEVNYITAVVISRSLISFFTTDSLSGIDHYEVGVIDKSRPVTESPAFFQSESPYQLPHNNIENARVIVRAFDRAGNIRDESIDVAPPFLPWKFVTDNAVILLGIILLCVILLYMLHYMFGHHIIYHLRRALATIIKEESQPPHPRSRKNGSRK